MRQRLLVTALLAATLVACGGQGPTPPDGADATEQASRAADTAFAGLSERWLDGAMRLQPVYATQVGDHRFDHLVGDHSA